jgi:hypothetical protein
VKRGTRAFVISCFGVIFSLLNTGVLWYGHRHPIGPVEIWSISMAGFFVGAIVADEVRSRPPEEVKPEKERR